jgi:hypothetical protein
MAAKKRETNYLIFSPPLFVVVGSGGEEYLHQRSKRKKKFIFSTIAMGFSCLNPYPPM